MKTKRLILSLLVALMSVAGAWAQNNVIRYTATEQLNLNWHEISGNLANVVTHEYNTETHEGVVTFDTEVTIIGYRAFFRCWSLTAIDLPASITSIGESAFEECPITSITLPETLTEMEECAFAFCPLTSITIPASVTSIGLYSFWNCPLQSITVNATTPPTLDYSFIGVDNSIPVYVPEGTADTYKAANYWKDFTNFIEMIPWLNLASSDSSLGKVYGAGRYNTTTEVTIYAIPEAGSKFIGWSDGNTENPRQYVVMSDATLTANFAEAAAELLGPMGEQCTGCPAVVVTKGDKIVKLYQPDKVEFIMESEAK